MIKSLIQLAFILFIFSCKDKECNDNKKATTGFLNILLENGFSNDTVSISYGNKTLLSSRLTTNPSSEVAHDFIGLDFDLAVEDKIIIFFNGKISSCSLKKYYCYKALILRKKKNQIEIIGSNKTLDYQ